MDIFIINALSGKFIAAHIGKHLVSGCIASILYSRYYQRYINISKASKLGGKTVGTNIYQNLSIKGSIQVTII